MTAGGETEEEEDAASCLSSRAEPVPWAWSYGASPLSLAEAATRIIFCRDKSFVCRANIILQQRLLSRQKYASFVATFLIYFLSR